MSQLIFYYGTMKSGKSLDLIKTYMNYKVKGEKVFIGKPIIDDRDGEEIKTRLGLSVDCKLIPQAINILPLMIKDACEKDNISAVLIDEAQFLTDYQVAELVKIADDGIPVICWGLKNDFTSALFEGSRALLELADKFQEIKTVCQYCEKKATLNLRLKNGEPADLDDNQIEIGDEEYVQVCRKHFYNAYKNKI